METASKLKRTPYVWTIYILVGLFSFMLSMIGPMVPYLKDEFNMSYSFAALHQSAFALGMVIMGIFGNKIIIKLSIPLCLWGGIFGMILGLLIMATAQNSIFTLLGVLLMSLCGTLTLDASQMLQASFPQEKRGQIVLEANMTASIFTMFVPLVLLLGAKTSLSWRIVLPIMAFSVLLTSSFGIKATKDKMIEHNAKSKSKMERKFWLCWVLAFFGVSVEWAISFWCMSYLLSIPSYTREIASLGTIFLGFSAVTGRFISSILVKKYKESSLLIISTLLVALGFPLYFLHINIVLTFLGILLMGLGSANFYPLSLSMAMENAKENAAQAGSLIPVASGSAIGLAPFLLGALADITSLQKAILYIVIGSLIIFVLTIFTKKNTNS